MLSLNGSIVCSIDLETTGRRAGYHEIIQIAVVPLTVDLKVNEAVRPFYTTIRPEFPERAELAAKRVNRLDIDHILMYAPTSDRVRDLLREWVDGLNLPFGKLITPLAHNWAFESAFLKAWLGVDEFDSLFYSTARDSMLAGLFINDQASHDGEAMPFTHVNLTAMCSMMGVSNQNPHDAYCDAVAGAELYRALIYRNLF